METGNYKKCGVDWGAYEVDVFTPHLYFTLSNGCGSNTLSLLTGIHPDDIKNPNKMNPEDWKDSFMVKFLKKHGFQVHPLTKCDVSCEGDKFASDNVDDRHVLLLSQLMGRNTASWTVVHNKLLYHNFQTCSFSGLYIVNCPILTCYLICHPNWKMNEKRKVLTKYIKIDDNKLS
jgi:hypothetical protein